MNSLLYGLELIGVVVLAISGGFQASIKQLDILGFLLVAAVAGIGGGTLRDLLLYHGPVFWVREPLWLWLTSAAAVLVYFAAPRVGCRYAALLWADALGLAAFCVVGAQAALEAGASAGVAVLIGTMTATFGGLIRDVVCTQTPLILKKEIYVAAAGAGAAVLVATRALELPLTIAVAAGVTTSFAARAVALIFALSLSTNYIPAKRD
jgi:uncharacterized membrane protein YeiH